MKRREVLAGLGLIGATGLVKAQTVRTTAPDYEFLYYHCEYKHLGTGDQMAELNERGQQGRDITKTGLAPLRPPHGWPRSF